AVLHLVQVNQVIEQRPVLRQSQFVGVAVVSASDDGVVEFPGLPGDPGRPSAFFSPPPSPPVVVRSPQSSPAIAHNSWGENGRQSSVSALAVGFATRRLVSTVSNVRSILNRARYPYWIVPDSRSNSRSRSSLTA